MPRAPGVLEAVFQARPRAHAAVSLRLRRELHRQDARDHGQVADGVDGKAGPLAPQSDHHARDRRTHDARAVEDARVERDCVAEVFLADHPHEQRLPPRHVEGVDHAHDDRQRENVLDGDTTAEGQHGEQRRLGQRDALRDDDDASSVEAVGRHAAEKSEEQDRRELQKLTTPSRKAEWDNRQTSQPCARLCIQAPVSETVCPTKNSRKFRCRSARNVRPKVPTTSAPDSLTGSLQDT